jgi:thioredoxin 1
MAGVYTQTFTDANFDSEVVNSTTPVLVDFWAAWCGPCRTVAPTIDALAEEYSGRVKVGKVDVDDNGNTAARFQIRSIPSLLVFKGGQVVDSRLGAVGKSELQKMLDAQL